MWGRTRHWAKPAATLSDVPTIKEPQLAELRILSLKYKFSREVKFHEDYVTFLEEVISEGYARKVLPDVVESSDDKVGFIRTTPRRLSSSEAW